jgi:hypothetical protein
MELQQQQQQQQQGRGATVPPVMHADGMTR